MPRLPYAKPEELDLNPRRIEEAGQLLKSWTAGPDAPIPGGALLVGRRGKVVPPLFFGKQRPEPDAEPISRDGLFLLASISKPVVYTAAMILVERGLLSLTDRVARLIPEFAAQHKEDILVAHLFTHTSGLPDMLENNEELRKRHVPLKEFVQGACDVVPLFPAGTKVSYQSLGTLMVAELVQRLTGQTIHEFLKKEIFVPLEMHASGLGSRGLTRNRLVRVEQSEVQQGTDWGWNSSYWQELGAPWGGMFSAPEDFAILCQMLLDEGRAGDVRLLAPSTVRTMTTNRLVDLPDLPEGVVRSQPWGLGWKLNHRAMPDSWGHTLGPRAFGHSGATGTLAWIDPDAEGFCLIFTTGMYAKHPWRIQQLSNMLGSAFA